MLTERNNFSFHIFSVRSVSISSLLLLEAAWAAECDGTAPSDIEDLGDVSCLIISQMDDIAALFVALSFICGIATVINSLFKFKQQRENPTQIPIATPIVMFFAGIFLIYIPSLIDTGQYSIFGEDGILGGTTGSGIDTFN